MKDLYRGLGLAVGITLYAGVTLADEVSDVLAAAEDEEKAFATCSVDAAWPMIKSDEPADQVASEAVTQCEDKAGAIKVALMGPPSNLTDAQADQMVTDLKRGMRAKVTEIVNKQRE